MSQINLQDAKERQRALDPTQSFIVQAPAGSGKTELLTQRFLRLLSCVKQPEEILAITFTKKSAAEMRARIIKAITSACNDPEPEASHAKQTWHIARQALQRNITLGWNLLDNPNRLQIQTIDSFNASLTRQLPLLSNFGAPLEIADDANNLYRQAVQEFLSHLEENYSWATAIEKLLLHMDNDLANVEKLLISMLAKRDQWLPYIATNANNPQLRKTLEENLTLITQDALIKLREQIPKETATELLTLSKFAAQNVLNEDPESPITVLANVDDLPGTKISDKKYWLGYAKLLLTEDGGWRKSITKKQGFPAPSDVKNPDQKSLLANFKLRMKELLNSLSEHENLRQALTDLNSLPGHCYDDAQWQTLDALHDILRVVVAQLKLTFQEHGKIDYIENAQAALTALGTDETPTDITLALDYKIQHILIDEFQDTSNSQYRLLEKLITGWQSNDGRTLFVVGDPMQSIYRFREAEVGLFIRARKHGIGHLDLEPLTLSVNFRSIPSVVNWVNESFEKVFPPFEDIASGAVSYSRSHASQAEHGNDNAVVLHPFLNADSAAESNSIIQLIKDLKKSHPDEKIAILVRSRTHLKAIIPALKAANLPFRALDIDPLTARPVIQDLLALTRALLHPADRIAWLAILRAPWCGLSLSDLLVIAGDKTKQIIYQQLSTTEILSALSIDGQQRLARIMRILEISFTERRRYNLRQWIENTWLHLGGPACVDQQADIEDANAFFKLLEKLDDASDLPDLKRLNDAINKLYAAPNNQADDSLQIMTIHNAKGLEFDSVILPQLERKASQDEKQLLRWMERPRTDDSSVLILAPIHAVGEEKNPIYDYIKRQNDKKSQYENSRLLYVAATRAKKRLHIFFNLKTKENNNTEMTSPASNSLLEKLWPAIKHQIQAHTIPTTSVENTVDANTIHQKQIKRLVSNWTHPIIQNSFDTTGYHQKNTGFYLPNNNPKIIGTLIHQILQQISQLGITWWNSESSSTHHSYIKKQLLQLGMQSADINNTLSIVDKAIKNTLNDSRGQWILHAHGEAQSELPLTTSTKNHVIDRTFVDETGTRWIIDYKSSLPDNENIEDFLHTEKKQYEKQLWEYYHAIKQIDQRPIRVGLYFPLIPAWKEWSFDN